MIFSYLSTSISPAILHFKPWFVFFAKQICFYFLLWTDSIPPLPLFHRCLELGDVVHSHMYYYSITPLPLFHRCLEWGDIVHNHMYYFRALSGLTLSQTSSNEAFHHEMKQKFCPWSPENFSHPYGVAYKIASRCGAPRPPMHMTDVGTETAFRLDQRKHFRKSNHLLRSEVSWCDLHLRRSTCICTSE